MSVDKAELYNDPIVKKIIELGYTVIAGMKEDGAWVTVFKNGNYFTFVSNVGLRPLIQFVYDSCNVRI